MRQELNDKGLNHRTMPKHYRNYVAVPRYDRTFTVIPKNRTLPSDGSYRNFQSEFPLVEKREWPWQAAVPESGDVRADIDIK